jgi:hypothetical protein
MTSFQTKYGKVTAEVRMNFIRPHMSLNRKTPAEVANINLQLGQNKWEAHHRPLTFAALAQHLLMLGKKTKDESS